MAARSDAGSIDQYISEFPPDTQAALQEMRHIIHEVAPDASETIAYAIPTFDLNGKHLVHFAGFAKHVGLYPMPSGIDRFAPELARYKQGKGSVQFPLDEPLPVELVRRIVAFRVDEIGAGPKQGGQR